MFKYAEFGCNFCEIHHKMAGNGVKGKDKWSDLLVNNDFLGVINQIIERIGYKKRGAFAPLEGRVIMRQVWGG